MKKLIGMLVILFGIIGIFLTAGICLFSLSYLSSISDYVNSEFDKVILLETNANRFIDDTSYTLSSFSNMSSYLSDSIVHMSNGIDSLSQGISSLTGVVSSMGVSTSSLSSSTEQLSEASASLKDTATLLAQTNRSVVQTYNSLSTLKHSVDAIDVKEAKSTISNALNRLKLGIIFLAVLGVVLFIILSLIGYGLMSDAY
ncbi:hypothetical protein J7K41_01840 [Candidatus Micrarchaeota archaeon]|nr:hypothetical protein [Candidatus Micrarchaeota archaeon]